MPFFARHPKALIITALLQVVCFGYCSAADSNSTEVATKIAELRENMDVFGLDFSADGKYLSATSVSDSDEVHVWDWQGSKSIVQKMKKGGGSRPTPEPLRYSTDGRYLAACHGRAQRNIVIHVWDSQTGNLAHHIDEPKTGSCSAIGFTPDGQLLVRVGEIGPRPKDSLVAYSTKDWEPVWSLRTIPFFPTTVAVSPDGKFAAVGGGNYGPGIKHQPQILIVDLLKRAIVRAIDAFPIETRIESVVWHPDGIHIAVGAVVGTPEIVKIFNAHTGEMTASESAERSRVLTLRYSPDGKYLVESGVHQSIRIWDGQHQTLLQEIHGVAGSLAFTRDGKFLAMGGDNKILIWQMK